MKLWTLMLNDFPIGIYTSSEKADEAAKIHEEKFFKYSEARMRYYRSYEFQVDAEANL